MQAVPIFDALTALHMLVTAKSSDSFKLPHDLWLKAMQAEVGLRQALKDAGLQIEVEQGAEA